MSESIRDALRCSWSNNAALGRCCCRLKVERLGGCGWVGVGGGGLW